jgi:transposase
MIPTQTTAVPKLFIGMDVHKKSWTVHIKTDLFDYKTVTMPADVQNLQQYVENKFPEHEVSCCYEAGCCGYWIARGLKQLNWKVIVVNPADVPRTNKQDWQKTDYYLLMSVSGIGGITAAGILAELGDIRRFGRLDELASLVGLVPGIYQSSDNRICLGLSQRSNRYLRSLLVEASWVAVRTDMALQQYYRKHAYKEPNKAIIKVAHKLLSRIRAVVNSGQPYQMALIK